MAALVTIAIPCFNAERWIGAAVQSALDQTWPQKEIIVVDDGSSDGSLAALEKFGSAIQLHRGAHRGGNAARNLALAAARGEWVQFLDADDYLEPAKIAQQFAETDSGANADILYSPVWAEQWRDGAVATRELSHIDPRADLYTQWLAWELPQTGGALWHRSALAALGGWREGQPCCQEHELYLRALTAGLRFVFAPTPGAVYRLWSEESLCRKDPREVIRVKTALIDQLREVLTARQTWTPVHQRTAARTCFEMARMLARDDLDAAETYHRDRRLRGLFHPEGPAAPRRYRLTQRLLGFRGAERLARLLR